VKTYALLATLCLVAPAQADALTEVSTDITQAELEAKVYWLADDARGGRGLVDDAGLEESAAFIAERFADLGLKPLPGEQDYFQRFELPLVFGYEAARLAVAGEPVEDEAFVPLSFAAAGDFEGELAVVGYGVSDPSYDDFAGADVAGKVVLMLRYEPFDAEGASRLGGGDGYSENASLTTKVSAAAEAGAAAVLLVNPPMPSAVRPGPAPRRDPGVPRHARGRPPAARRGGPAGPGLPAGADRRAL